MKARELAELLLRVPEADVRWLLENGNITDMQNTSVLFNAEANTWVLVVPVAWIRLSKAEGGR